ncbi:MAG TPA: alcohol dehydrogenase catalytic domain-containing protein [Steroidobacteraceae bacterium]|nr:alcohol dehydrogenase catalytic domain-containing protein [Steroidobacteraceae bacterium]
MATMRAMAVPEARAKLQLQERQVPGPGRHEVLIRVQACGVCHSDVATVAGLMPGMKYPRVPGHEVIGTLEAIGPDVDGWQVGTRVGVGWSPGYCGYCSQCRHGNAFACENIQGATGVSRDGGYATHMLAHVTALARVPSDLDAVESAPLLCAGITTFNALRHSGAGAGDLVAIHGVGGLGHLGIQFAARLGFRVVAVNRGRDKEELARSLGAQEYIDTQSGDPAAALRALGGARAILATVTDAAAMQAVIGGLGSNGTLLVIGAVGALTVDPMDLLRKRAAVRAWYSGTSIDSEDTLNFSQRQRVRSMNEIFPLEQAQAAYDRMLSGKARFRVVLKMP